jgi:hypothetical protein
MDNEDWMPLVTTISYEHTEITAIFIAHTDLNTANNHGHVVIIAVARHHIPLLLRSIEYGADINRKDREGARALTIVTSHGFCQIVEALLNCGATQIP